MAKWYTYCESVVNAGDCFLQLNRKKDCVDGRSVKLKAEYILGVYGFGESKIRKIRERKCNKMKKLMTLILAMMLTLTLASTGAYAASNAVITNIPGEWQAGESGMVISNVEWVNEMGTGIIPAGEFILESSNPNVLNYDGNGKLIPGTPGKTMITATAKDGSVVAAKEVTVYENVKQPEEENPSADTDKVTITREGDRKINIGSNSKQLKITSDKENVRVKWNSSNTKVAGVDSKGTLNPKAFGTTTVSATAENGNTVKWTVTVNKLSVSMKDGSSKTVTKYIKNIKNYKKGKWSSSKGIAHVSGEKVYSDTFKSGSKETKTKKLNYKVGGKTYTLVVEVTCKHSYEKNLTYYRKCKEKADYYEDEYYRLKIQSYSLYGNAMISNLDRQIKALDKSLKWDMEAINKYYKCTKCGSTKAQKKR